MFPLTNCWSECKLVKKISDGNLAISMGFPGGSGVKNLPASIGDARDSGSIPGLGRSFGEGNGNPP